MAASDSTTIPVKGQAFRFTVAVRSITDGNPITGGLSDLAATASLDGGAFGATGITATEIGTTGFVTVDVDATRMAYDSIVIQVTASDTGAMYPLVELRPEDLSELELAADAATVKRPFQFLRQLWGRHFNKVTVNESTGAIVQYQSDGSTSEIEGTLTRASGVETKSEFE